MVRGFEEFVTVEGGLVETAVLPTIEEAESVVQEIPEITEVETFEIEDVAIEDVESETLEFEEVSEPEIEERSAAAGIMDLEETVEDSPAEEFPVLEAKIEDTEETLATVVPLATDEAPDFSDPEPP